MPTTVSGPLPDGVASAYREAGWCRFPYRFSDRSVRLLRERVECLSGQRRPEIVHEEDNRTVRAIHGCHTFDELCTSLVRHPHLVALAEMLTGDRVYVYQFKVNIKQARAGAAWPWHQDFTFWSTEDGMPRPDAVNIAVSLDDTHEENGPLIVIPGSHRLGTLNPPEITDRRGDWRTHVAADLAYTVDPDHAEELAGTLGRTAVTGPAGSIHAFDPDIVHASSRNTSPDRRALLVVTYNPVKNAPTRTTRPEFLVARDTTPLVPRYDDRLALQPVFQ
ncbi:phytanoyl-CoA dioxygenase family protein [Streptomyces sp. CAU 1734]|uniref:phytanoyl-CoA dioxygenase family protein n=1 Tax=Streptomyces sp. CAU 1734 TaxID=3140360 RepID=UPI00325FF3C2